MFEPSERLWRVWGLILTAIFPLLQSCWGFSFALEHGVSFFDGIQYYPVNTHSPMSCFPTINSTTGLPELTQDWGSRLLEGTNKSLCTPGPRRKEQWPHKRLTRTCPLVSRSLQQRGVGRGWPVAELGALSAALPAWDLLKKITIIFITSTRVWPQVKQPGRNPAPPINRKLD